MKQVAVLEYLHYRTHLAENPRLVLKRRFVYIIRKTHIVKKLTIKRNGAVFVEPPSTSIIFSWNNSDVVVRSVSFIIPSWYFSGLRFIIILVSCFALSLTFLFSKIQLSNPISANNPGLIVDQPLQNNSQIGVRAPPRCRTSPPEITAVCGITHLTNSADWRTVGVFSS
jgi:hypothetical protein